MLQETDGRHVTVRLADGQQISVLRRFVIPIGGASPCPLLQVGDHVLAQVRTRKGPHPSDDGSCDYFIPGTVQVLPENNRKGHALHTVLVFNGRSVMCPRRGMVKISESLYKTVSKFINVKMSSSHSEVEQGSKYASDLNDDRSTIMNDSVSQRSTTKSPLGTNSAHSSPKGSVSHVSLDEASQCESREDVYNETQGQSSPDRQAYEAEIESLMANQQTQCELLEQYQRELAQLQLRQREMELELKKREMETNNMAEVEDVDDGGRGGAQPAKENEELGSGLPVESRDIAVNTGPWMEEKAVETDPMTESRGVGTEWSDTSSSETESEKENDDVGEGQGEEEGGGKGEGERETVNEDEAEKEALSEFPSSETTPTSSPLHVSTPAPSTPAHSAIPSTHSRATSPQHTSTPTPSHTNTPTHDTIATPIKSPLHELGSTHSNETKDLSSIAQHLVELGVDAFIGREVLARWLDDGWYYRTKVVQSMGDLQYQVMDACEDVETIHLSNIITDTQDAETPLQVKNSLV